MIHRQVDGSRYSILEYESAYNSKRLEEHTARACNVYCPRLNICHGRKYLQSERLNSAHRFHGMQFERNNISIGWKKKKRKKFGNIPFSFRVSRCFIRWNVPWKTLKSTCPVWTYKKISWIGHVESYVSYSRTCLSVVSPPVKYWKRSNF